MIELKTKEEIEIMRQGGKILAEVFSELLKKIKADTSEVELDKIAESLIKGKGTEPAFKSVKGYGHAICLSTNEVVVHGKPTNYRFKEGDIVGIDCGIFYQGFNTDMAETVRIEDRRLKMENRKDEIGNFLGTGKKALREAIKVAKPGNRVGHISKTIQDIIEGAGYSVVRTLVGHGIGKNLHEEPEVPGFLTGGISETPKLEKGMTLAIEVIYNQGGPEVVIGEDGWTIKTKDKSLSGLFEKTVAITSRRPVVLTG